MEESNFALSVSMWSTPDKKCDFGHSKVPGERKVFAGVLELKVISGQATKCHCIGKVFIFVALFSIEMGKMIKIQCLLSTDEIGERANKYALATEKERRRWERWNAKMCWN